MRRTTKRGIVVGAAMVAGAGAALVPMQLPSPNWTVVAVVAGVSLVVVSIVVAFAGVLGHKL